MNWNCGTSSFLLARLLIKHFNIVSSRRISSVLLSTNLSTLSTPRSLTRDTAIVNLRGYDRLGIYFNNLINQIVQYEHTNMKKRHPVIQRYEHAFLLWKMFIQSLILEFMKENSCLLIEVELRRLHRRFDHLSARCLHEILHRSEHNEIEFHAIEHLIKFCHHCQLHGKSSGRFTFSIRNENIQFNYSIVMNILYMKWKSGDNKLVLHIMNEAIRFQADRWLKIFRQDTSEISWESHELTSIWNHQIWSRLTQTSNLWQKNLNSTQTTWRSLSKRFSLRHIIQLRWWSAITTRFVECMR